MIRLVLTSCAVAALLLILLPNPAPADVLASGDAAVWMEEDWRANGTSFAYPVYLENSTALSRIVLPLEFLPVADILLDSLSLVGTRLDGLGSSSTWFDNTSRTLYLDFAADPGLPLAAGSGEIVNLWFSIDQQAVFADVLLDTTFISPDKNLYFADESGTEVSTSFAPGVLHIVSYVPIISLDPESFLFEALIGETPTSQILTVSNLGIDPLNWHIDHKPTWLLASLELGTAPSAVELTPDLTGLTVGVYYDSIVIADSLAANHRQTALVELRVDEETLTGLAGWVEDTGTNPIVGAAVEIWDDFPTGTLLYSTTSGPGGAFSLPTVPDGDYDLHAYRVGYYPNTYTVTAPDDDILVILSPTSDPQPTDYWITLECDENYFEGSLLPVGSVIEAHAEDGTLCGQFFVHTVGAYGPMEVYGDDPVTPGIEGALPGDEIEIRINTIPAVAWPLPVWTFHGDVQQVCLNTTIIETVCIDLDAGWNLISWNVDTYNDETGILLAEVIDCVDVILGFELGSATYDPDLVQFSTLDYLDHLHGYWFRMDCPAELCVTGVPVDPQTPIALETNWNLVSYLPDQPEAIETALASIWGDLVVALGFEGAGLSYEVAHPELASLDSLKPEYGYWLKTTAPAILTYPGPLAAPKLIAATGSMVPVAVPAGVTPTPEWIDLYGEAVTLDGALLAAGSIVQIFDESGNLCGEYQVSTAGRVPFTPVYGDDRGTEFDEGAGHGSVLSLTVDGVRVNETVNWTGFGDRVLLEQLTSSSKSEAQLPLHFELAQNYPNPFNPQTVINFSLPRAATARVEIFNVLGEKVNTLIDRFLPAGNYRVIWDGTLVDGAMAPSALYFYRLSAGDFADTKKMMLVK